ALVSPPASYSGMSGRAGAAAMAAPAAHVAASAARARNVAVILRLPDRDALVGRDVHLVARLHAERVVERGLVHRRSVGAEAPGRVRVDLEEPDRFLLAALLRPDLRPADVEALRPGEAVDHRRSLAMERDLVGLPRDREPRIVGDVL